jgi:hypothetical protein
MHSDVITWHRPCNADDYSCTPWCVPSRSSVVVFNYVAKHNLYTTVSPVFSHTNARSVALLMQNCSTIIVSSPAPPPVFFTLSHLFSFRLFDLQASYTLFISPVVYMRLEKVSKGPALPWLDCVRLENLTRNSRNSRNPIRSNFCILTSFFTFLEFFPKFFRIPPTLIVFHH